MNSLTAGARWVIAATLALALGACGGGGDGEPDGGGSPSRVFVADSGNTAIVSFINANPSPGVMRVDRTISGPSVSGTMPELAYDPGNDRLYIVNNSSIAVLNNAGTRNGSAAPDRTISSGSFTTTIASIFLDTANDILYVASGFGTVLAFSNASTLNGLVLPTRTLLISRGTTSLAVNDIYVDTNRDILYVSAQVTGVVGVNRTIQSYDDAKTLPDNAAIVADRELDFSSTTIGDVVGDRNGNRIFVADTSGSILVFDNASTADGIGATRTITLLDSPLHIALAPVGNRLYAIAANRQGINIIDNASIATGMVTPTLVTSTSAGNFTAIAVAP